MHGVDEICVNVKAVFVLFCFASVRLPTSCVMALIAVYREWNFHRPGKTAQKP
jgi:hypothetical protein